MLLALPKDYTASTGLGTLFQKLAKAVKREMFVYRTFWRTAVQSDDTIIHIDARAPVLRYT